MMLRRLNLNQIMIALSLDAYLDITGLYYHGLSIPSYISDIENNIPTGPVIST